MKSRPTKLDYFVNDLTKYTLLLGTIYVLAHLLAAFQSGRLPL